MKPITRTQDDIVKEFEEVLDTRTKDLGIKLDEISNKMTTKPREEKIEDIIKKMKDRVPERIIRKPEVREESEPEIKREPEPIKKIEEIVKKVEEHKHEDDVFCPTCNKGHVHKLDSSGLTMQCTDGNCKEKFFVIPESADYTCTDCGYPIKKPADDKVLEACPFCKNNKAQPFINGKPAIKFDFSKLKK